jgi:rRNA maturation RNase YbeY
MGVFVIDEQGFFADEEIEEFTRGAECALSRLMEGGEVCITFVGDEEMRELNSRYRNLHRTTDVLSFPQEGGPAPNILGDIVISVETARRNALRYNESLKDEVLRLIVHGMLHLLGFDHKKAAERAEMRAKENELIQAIRDKVY